jgi:hypothetical protein
MDIRIFGIPVAIYTSKKGIIRMYAGNVTKAGIFSNR